MIKKDFTLAIPVNNPDPSRWNEVLVSVSQQRIQPTRKIFVNSSASAAVIDMALQHGFELMDVQQFNHGKTRQACVEMLADYPFIVFMSQDVVLENADSFAFLLRCFDDKTVSAAYGRQLVFPTSPLLEKHTREMNYPPESRIKSRTDIPELGLTTAFCSNAFAAYRITDLLAVGGFPETDFGEDMLLAAKLLLADGRIAYCAEALVRHSHNFTLREEFMRGRAIGRMHRQNPWLLEKFGRPEKHGRSLVKYCHGINTITRCGIKYLGYLGGKILGL